MSDFLARLHDEKQELEEKFNKLGFFIGDEGFNKLSSANRILLQHQHGVMGEYLNVLTVRIELIEK